MLEKILRVNKRNKFRILMNDDGDLNCNNTYTDRVFQLKFEC